MKKYLFILWVLAAAVAPAISQEKIDQRRPASDNAAVAIENIAGKVIVSGWSREEVEITGTLGGGADGLEVTGDRDHVHVKVKYPNDNGPRRDIGDTILSLHVPQGAKLKVETVSALIDVSDFEGETELQSVSGTVHLTGSPKTADLTTVSGSISVDSKARLDEGAFKTVSGSIEVSAELSPQGRFKFGTVSGDVTLNVPRGASADVEASSFSGRIENDFGETPKKTNPYLPSSELRFQIGGGGARVTLQTLSGRIRIAQQ
ncbi:MAG TPA: DUF4097 family beta strand repeat-containing protein [Verrucomicrobiae bacterium]|nr:DUF4097 family beta strand repeat-containing protein [Verrucomicrobiae bacterium]